MTLDELKRIAPDEMARLPQWKAVAAAWHRANAEAFDRAGPYPNDADEETRYQWLLSALDHRHKLVKNGLTDG